MPTKRHYAKPYRKHLLDEILTTAEQEAADFAKEVGKFLTSQFERTFRYWNQSQANKFDRPSVKIHVEIYKTTKGIHLKINALVIDAKGSAHPLWHWLTFGTKTITAKKNLSFPLRWANRTFPDQLDASPFPGWRMNSKGKVQWVTIKKGKKRRGIKPRNWYEAVVAELTDALDDLQRNNLLKYEIDDTKVKK